MFARQTQARQTADLAAQQLAQQHSMQRQYQVGLTPEQQQQLQQQQQNEQQDQQRLLQLQRQELLQFETQQQQQQQLRPDAAATAAAGTLLLQQHTQRLHHQLLLPQEQQQQQPPPQVDGTAMQSMRAVSERLGGAHVSQPDHHIVAPAAAASADANEEMEDDIERVSEGSADKAGGSGNPTASADADFDAIMAMQPAYACNAVPRIDQVGSMGHGPADA